MSNIDSLPAELLEAIFLHVDIRTKLVLTSVCHNFRDILSIDHLWKHDNIAMEAIAGIIEDHSLSAQHLGFLLHLGLDSLRSPEFDPKILLLAVKEGRADCLGVLLDWYDVPRPVADNDYLQSLLRELLFTAATFGRTACVQLLVTLGADVNFTKPGACLP